MIPKPPKDLLDVFVRKAPTRIILAINNKVNYGSLISKEVDTTYSHTVKQLYLFKEAGLVEMEKVGRQVFITLTPKGKKLRHTIEAIKHALVEADKFRVK